MNSPSNLIISQRANNSYLFVDLFDKTGESKQYIWIKRVYFAAPELKIVLLGN